MPYTVTPTDLPEVLVLEPRVFGDERGYFYESFNARDFRNATAIDVNFVQDNHSRSIRNVLRGIHFQIQHPQGKLVRVSIGEVFDVAVDLRRSSPNFGKWAGVTLSADNKKQLWIPPGFGHGFAVTSEVVEFQYKTTDYWHSEYERTLLWCDPSIAVAWPISGPPIVAPKDASGLPLDQIETFS